MGVKKALPRFKSIKGRLIFWMLIISILPLLVSAGIIYAQRLRNIKSMQFGKLEAVRDLKVREINRWLEERTGGLLSIAENFGIRDLGRAFSNPEQTQEELIILQDAETLLKRYLANHRDYIELSVMNTASGRIEVSTDKMRIGEDRSKDLYFTEPLRTGELYIKDIYYSATLRQPAMTFSAPVRGLAHDGGHVIGVLVARIDLEGSLYDLLLNRTGMGNTGETLIVNSDVVALNELRHRDNAPLRLKIEARPAVMAAGGETGIMETVDYRGEQVMAAYTHILRTGWGFVAKQDLSELYGPIAVMRTSFLIVLAVSFLAIYLAARFLSSSLVRPIGELAEALARLQRGDPEARSRVERNDELGFLARSFNSMADSIQSQMAIQQGNSDLSESMVKAATLDSLGRGALIKLLEITDAQFGVIYLYDEEEALFKRLSSVGVNEELLEPFSGDRFTGELGRALATRKISHTKEIPKDTLFTFTTIAGTAVPRELLTIPLITKDRVTALIALGSLKSFTRESLEILRQSWPGLNTGFSNLLANEETRRLAEKLGSSNDELTSMNDELQSQSEELHQQTEELKAQKQELEIKGIQVEEANRLKSEFLSNMSHELRTPLNSILALSQLIMTDGIGKDPVQESEYMKVIERNGLILLNLINDILDLSRIEVGQMDLNLSEFEPEDTLRRAAETTRPMAESKKLELQVKIDRAPVMHSDEKKLRQILLNLLSNAIKFTEEGGIEVVLSESRGEVSFVVRDTGIGISESDLESIFQEFRQVDGSTTRKYEGVGLGLSISQKLAGLLGGRITVQSRPGKGSVFTLLLPARYREEEVIEPEAAAAFPEKPPARETPLILVVEDNEVAALQIRSALQGSGWNVTVAPGGSQAIESIAGQVPDLVILDLMMPKVDGFQVLQKMRSERATRRLPVLVLTAKELTSDDRSRLKHNNIRELIQKGSIDREKLVASVARILGRGQAGLKPARKAPEESPVTPSPKSGVILVVEDNRDNLLTITAILDSLQYRHLEAEDGETAVKMAGELRPALILMDVQLPMLSGLDAARLIKADPQLSGIPIIALTAIAMKGDRDEILAGGCDDYLCKPLQIAELTEILNKWMGEE